MTSEILILLLACFSGGALGVLFYGGLWLTVKKGLVSNQPALWFLGSLLLRTAIVLLGFFFVSGGSWERLSACLLGFFTTRLIVTWKTRSSSETQLSLTQEVRHSP